MSKVMQDMLETLPGWSCSHAPGTAAGVLRVLAILPGWVCPKSSAVTGRLLSRVRTDPEARVWRSGSAKLQATHMLRGHLEP